MEKWAWCQRNRNHIEAMQPFRLRCVYKGVNAWIVQKFFIYCVYKGVIAWIIQKLFIYCSLPVFMILLVLTLGLRDFGRYRAREFLKNVLRKAL
jgi:hypothetical protein